MMSRFVRLLPEPSSTAFRNFIHTSDGEGVLSVFLE